MYPLRDFLRAAGYDARTVNLPTTFKSLEVCFNEFTKTAAPLLQGQVPLHFVGHSMGGLIVRMFLEDNPDCAQR